MGEKVFEKKEYTENRLNHTIRDIINFLESTKKVLFAVSKQQIISNYSRAVPIIMLVIKTHKPCTEKAALLRSIWNKTKKKNFGGGGEKCSKTANKKCQ